MIKKISESKLMILEYDFDLIRRSDLYCNESIRLVRLRRLPYLDRHMETVDLSWQTIQTDSDQHYISKGTFDKILVLKFSQTWSCILSLIEVESKIEQPWIKNEVIKYLGIENDLPSMFVCGFLETSCVLVRPSLSRNFGNIFCLIKDIIIGKFWI